jgi:hypothetical protein
MDLWTGIFMAIGLFILLLVIPYFVVIARRGRAGGHTWFTRRKPLGHSDIGPDIGGTRLTRHGADDARGSRY